MQIPVCSATGRIFAMYAMGSLNSSAVGSKTGASGGGTNSASALVMASCLTNVYFEIFSLRYETCPRLSIFFACTGESPGALFRTPRQKVDPRRTLFCFSTEEALRDGKRRTYDVEISNNKDVYVHTFLIVGPFASRKLLSAA